MRGLWPTLIKSAIFIAVTVFATAMLAVSITNGGGGGHHYTAIFSDVTSLNNGDDVRMAGVRIGQVGHISVIDRRRAKVTLSISSSVNLASTATATIRYRNLVGQRYIALDQGAGSPDDQLKPGSTIGIDHTQPALDLTTLFNGFQPLFQALDPKQVNQLSYEVIQVFQGEGATIDNLLSQTAQLTSTLADKDQVIGEVIDNLTTVLDTVNQRGDELADMITTLQQLVSGLSEDRGAIGSAITGLGGLTKSVGGLLEQGRAPLKTSIESLGALAGNLNQEAPLVDQFLHNLPTKLNTIGKLASYGSWLNFYVCSITGQIPTPSGYALIPNDPTDPTKGEHPDPNAVGVAPVNARCQ
jgi:phospholipid/cholesterol/gamma-HCH transport system substrate-binding protein